MIIIFYGLLVLLSRADWSWLWFAIAFMMQVINTRRHVDIQELMEDVQDWRDNNDHWKGPYA